MPRSLIAVAFLVASRVVGQYDPFAGARQANVNGASLAYVERGTGGTPVVLVHGSGADLRTWGYQLQFFGNTRRTIAYSRRFHHPNAPPDANTPYLPAQHADDLAALIAAIAGGRADVVAASYGGVVALLLARDHPRAVRRLVLVEPVVFSLLPPDSEVSRDALVVDVARRQLLDGDVERAMRSFITAIIGPGFYELMPATTREMLRQNLPELTAEARAPMVTTTPRYTCADASRIAARTLLVDGGASPPFMREMTRQLAMCLPGVERRTVPGAAHAVHAQQVQGFNTLVQDFLDRE
jgi:pimeloyl-ACP methyl ester carboxylesterase